MAEDELGSPIVLMSQVCCGLVGEAMVRESARRKTRGRGL